MSRKPIEHVPAGSEMAGACVPARTPLHRVLATVEWSDGTTSVHKAITNQWTRSHVKIRFMVPTPHTYRHYDLYKIWLPTGQVRRNDQAPELGEIIPAPWIGPMAVKDATLADIAAWPRMRRKVKQR